MRQGLSEVKLASEYGSGATWTERTAAGSRQWRAITSSSNGTKLAAVDYYGSGSGGSIYTSSDSGTTWVERVAAGAQTWSSITSSSDGTKLAATANNEYIYISSDSGVSWTPRVAAGMRGWNAINMSSDGQKLVAAVSGGYIYTSSDSGATWTQRSSAGSRGWTSVATSDDGQKLIAAVDGGYIYTSSDAGATWTQKSSEGSSGWTSVAISADGQKLVVAETVMDPDTGNYGGYIYTSSNYGETWTKRTTAGSHGWKAVIASSDGTRLVAVDSMGAADGLGGYLYTSSDFGATWTTHTEAFSREWSAVASSADGTKLFGAASNRFIYKGMIATPAGSFFDYSTISTTQEATVANAELSVISNSCYSIDQSNVTLLDASGVVAPSNNISIVGGIGYNLNCISQGGTANATVVLGSYFSDLSTLHIYKKLSTSSVLQDITSKVGLTNTRDADGNPITVLDYTLIDGGIYDEDGVANGTIVDPVYIGRGSVAAQSSSAAGTLADTGSDMWGIGFAAVTMIISSLMLIKRRSQVALYK